jgi:hypothetical protein
MITQSERFLIATIHFHSMRLHSPYLQVISLPQNVAFLSQFTVNGQSRPVGGDSCRTSRPIEEASVDWVNVSCLPVDHLG